MGRKKRSSNGKGAIIVVIIVLVYLAIKELWPLLILIGISAGLIFILRATARAFRSRKLSAITKEVLPIVSKAYSKRIVQFNWFGEGTRIDLGSYVIDNPMTYFSEDIPDEYGEYQGIVIRLGEYGTQYEVRDGEASCIFKSLPIGLPAKEPVGALGYWPSYAGLTPNQKANYLSWLSSGRRGELDDIGYAFIFFYGLERRLLIENEDYDFIIGEVISLLRRYTFSGSFNGYLDRFLAYAMIRRGLEKLDEGLLDDVTAFSSTEDSLNTHLAWFYLKGRPLPASWAMRVARNDPRSSRSVVVDRVSEEFNALFVGKYNEKYGDGIKLKVAQRPRKIEYRPASPSLLRLGRSYGETERIKPFEIPNVLGIQSQFKGLVQLWAECIEELRPLSNRIGKGVSADSRAAYEALPEELRKETEHPDAPKWEKLVSDSVNEDGIVLAKVSKISEIQGVPFREKLTPTQSQELAETAGYIGYSMEPDARLTGKSYAWTDLVSLFPLEGAARPVKNQQYSGASTMLELGMSIAAADGEIEEEEINHVANFLEGQFLLEPEYVRRLESLKHVFIAQPPSLNGIGKKLRNSLKPDQLEKVGKFLVGVAAADGRIEKEEIAVLKRAYKAMGLEPDKLVAFIDSIRGDLTEPVEIRKGKRSTAGEAIPVPLGGQKAGTIYLDESRIMSILQETKEVSAILGDVFSTSEEEGGSEPLAVKANEQPFDSKITDARFENLDPKYHPILSELLKKESWAKKSFEELCKKFYFMPSGVLDVVNEWADENLGDMLIEEGDPLLINKAILREN